MTCEWHYLLSFSPSDPSKMGYIPWIGTHNQGIYETGICHSPSKHLILVGSSVSANLEYLLS